jgi:hypothetical protein
MTKTALREIDFERHRRRFQVAANAGFALGVCDAQGVTVWAAEDRDADLAQALAEIGTDGLAGDVPATGCRQRALQDGRTILSATIAVPSAAPIGYVVAVGDMIALDAGERGVMLALETSQPRSATSSACTAAGLPVRGACRRYEELHLVCGSTSTSGSSKLAGRVAQAARVCAGHMNVDPAAFVTTLDLTLSRRS